MRAAFGSRAKKGNKAISSATYLPGLGDTGSPLASPPLGSPREPLASPSSETEASSMRFDSSARLTATANAILEAQGYKPTTTPNPDQPFKPDSTAIAKPDVDTPSSPPVTVKILASAYDPDRDVYVYCITPVTAKNPTYTVLTDSDLLKPTVVVGQRIKHQIAARTVLEYEITKIGVKGGEFKYGFEVKKRSDYVFDEDELRGLLEGHERASEVDREVNGGKGEGGE